MTPPQEDPSNLGRNLLHVLRGPNVTHHFPQGTTLFRKGDAGEGIYVIETGKVHAFLGGGAKPKQLLELAGPDAILGLSECMAGESHRVTAVAIDETMALFVPRRDLLSFLEKNSHVRLQIVRALSEDLHGLYHKFGSITAHPGRPRQRSLDEQVN